MLIFHRPYDDEIKKVNNPFGRDGDKSIEVTAETVLNNRIKTIKRNTAKLWRVHNANANQYKHKDKFVTLTFRANINDIDKCDRIFKIFIQRLNYFIGWKIEYQAVRELQSRGSLHYHMLAYNMPFVKHSDLLEIWAKNNEFVNQDKKSGVNIKAIDDGFQEMTSYLTGYMLKEMLENMDFLKGRKTILKSRGLKQPTVINYPEIEIEVVADDIKKGLTFLDSQVTYYRLK